MPRSRTEPLRHFGQKGTSKRRDLLAFALFENREDRNDARSSKDDRTRVHYGLKHGLGKCTKEKED